MASRPPPKPPPPGTQTQSVFDELARLLDLLSSGNFGNGGGIVATPGQMIGDTIILSTSSIAGSSVVWTAPKDGFVLGYRCNLSSGYSLAINNTGPAAAGNPGDGSVTTGLLDWTTATVGNAVMQTAFLTPFKTGDTVTLRVQSASKGIVHLYVGYAI